MPEFKAYIKNEPSMKSIDITSSVAAEMFESFKDGNPIEVRIPIKEGEEPLYRKGSQVRVQYENDEKEGRIVSDPIAIPSSSQAGKALSLIVEKG